MKRLQPTSEQRADYPAKLAAALRDKPAVIERERLRMKLRALAEQTRALLNYADRQEVAPADVANAARECVVAAMDVSSDD